MLPWMGSLGSLTGAVVFGTPDYMAPEQAIASDEVDVRVDIWSYCVVLYEMLSGTLPSARNHFPRRFRRWRATRSSARSWSADFAKTPKNGGRACSSSERRWPTGFGPTELRRTRQAHPYARAGRSSRRTTRTLGSGGAYDVRFAAPVPCRAKGDPGGRAGPGGLSLALDDNVTGFAALKQHWRCTCSRFWTETRMTDPSCWSDSNFRNGGAGAHRCAQFGRAHGEPGDPSRARHLVRVGPVHARGHRRPTASDSRADRARQNRALSACLHHRR